MIAKLVTHAATRAEAIAAQSLALDGFAIQGIRHNVPFLSALMAHERWQAGRLSTGFIAEEFPGGFEAPKPEGEIARRMAAVAAAIDHAGNERKRAISGQMREPEAVRFERELVERVHAVVAGQQHPQLSRRRRAQWCTGNAPPSGATKGEA